MNFYRIIYEYPRNEQIGSATFVSDNGRAAQVWAGHYCKMIGAYLLHLLEGRPAQINDELELT